MASIAMDCQEMIYGTRILVYTILGNLVRSPVTSPASYLELFIQLNISCKPISTLAEKLKLKSKQMISGTRKPCKQSIFCKQETSISQLTINPSTSGTPTQLSATVWPYISVTQTIKPTASSI